MKFIDGGKRDPGSGDGFLMKRPKRWPIGLCIGLALFMATFAPAVAQAITFW